MPEKTKITLSDNELSLVKNVDWILTKQVIIQKVFDLFAANVPVIKKELLSNNELPEHILFSVPKIFKGENYLQLPYVIMDYPKCFEKEHIFAIRTMFWWGNFISITLHVSGKYCVHLKPYILTDNIAGTEDLYIGVNEDQWQHHFEANNFIPYHSLLFQERIAAIEKNSFAKLALKFNLDEWNGMPSLLLEGYKKMAAIINYRAGEKGL